MTGQGGLATPCSSCILNALLAGDQGRHGFLCGQMYLTRRRQGRVAAERGGEVGRDMPGERSSWWGSRFWARTRLRLEE